LEHFGVLALNFLEVDAQRIEAVIDVIVVGVTSYLIVKQGQG